MLQYMERAPVSLQRLSYLDNGEVLYRGDFHPGFGRDESQFAPQDGDEFEFNQDPPTQWWNHH